MENVRDRVTDYLRREVLFGDESRLPGPDDPLLGVEGVLDSLGLQSLIVFLESQFGIEVGDLDVAPENFETLSAVASFVERKQVGQ